LPRCDFSFGRRDLSIAAPQFFFWLVRSVDCRAVIYLLAGAICPLPRHDFSIGRCDPSIAAPQFFSWPPRSFDCRLIVAFSR
jgi:hypothetical protein